MATAVDGSSIDHEKQRSNSDINSNVKFELEKLNAATDGINHLETEYEEANALMQRMVNEALDSLGKSTKQIGKSTIEKANQYFEFKESILKAEEELHEAETWYEEAKRKVLLAKKRVEEVEKSALSSNNKVLDASVQEAINQANIEFSKAINRRNEYLKRQEDCLEVCSVLKKQHASLKKKTEKSIKKARPYFELKASLYKGLEQQRERVEKIGEGICFAKEQYSEVLGNLENISEEIHRKRKNRSNCKDNTVKENFRKSMNEASLNETEQLKMNDYINNPDRHNYQDDDEGNDDTGDEDDKSS